MLIVLDRANKQLWKANLKFNMPESYGFAEETDPPYGEGPCVEREDTLYVMDQGMMTAFDKATGTVLWQLPSVGIIGVFWDDKGMMYVNTTTASTESLRVFAPD